jgi:hypothetical protein
VVAPSRFQQNTEYRTQKSSLTGTKDIMIKISLKNTYAAEYWIAISGVPYARIVDRLPGGRFQSPSAPRQMPPSFGCFNPT